MFINSESVVTLKDGLIKNTQNGGHAIYNNTGTFIMNGGEVSQKVRTIQLRPFIVIVKQFELRSMAVP